MTEVITHDLQDIHNHPWLAAFSALMTLLIILGCAIGCGALLAVVMNLGVLL